MNFIGTIIQSIDFPEKIYTVIYQDGNKCYVNDGSYTHFKEEDLLRILNGDPILVDHWKILQFPVDFINIF